MSELRIPSRRDVESVLDMQSVAKSNLDVYRRRALDQTVTWPTVYGIIEDGRSDFDVKSGWMRSCGVFGTKTMSWNKENASLGLPLLQGLICLFDENTGTPVGVVDAEYITGMRTGAASAIGAGLLARKNAESLLIIGTGGQSAFQAAAFCELVPGVKTITVANPRNPERAAAKVRSLPEEISRICTNGANVSFDAVESADMLEDACMNADIIVTATPSCEPIVRSGWVRPGTHVSCMGADMPGKTEIDPEILGRSLVFADDLKHCIEAGEIEAGISAGIISENDVAGEIGELSLGLKGGRTSDEQITVFDSTGMALLDLACAKRALDISRGMGIGTVVEI